MDRKPKPYTKQLFELNGFPFVKFRRVDDRWWFLLPLHTMPDIRFDVAKGEIVIKVVPGDAVHKPAKTVLRGRPAIGAAFLRKRREGVLR